MAALLSLGDPRNARDCSLVIQQAATVQALRKQR
jgi:hypothetical protein